MVCAFLTDGAAIPGSKKRRGTHIWVSMGTGTEASQGGKYFSCCILNSHKQQHILPTLVCCRWCGNPPSGRKRTWTLRRRKWTWVLGRRSWTKRMIITHGLQAQFWKMNPIGGGKCTLINWQYVENCHNVNGDILHMQIAIMNIKFNQWSVV